MTPAPRSMCAVAGNFTDPLTGPLWNGWGVNTSNTRLQDSAMAGFTAAQVPRLKLRWAFGFPGDLDANAQPTIVGSRVFVGSQGAKVYSLSADSGCIHWFVQAAGAVRGAVTIGRVETAAGFTYAAFFRRPERQRVRRQRRNGRAVVECESRPASARADRRLAGFSRGADLRPGRVG